MSLSELARKFGTDKLSHGYCDTYETVLQPFKDNSFNFLEIGVFFGSSIKMWSNYFKNATIYGADTFEGKQGNGNIFDNADNFFNEVTNNKDNYKNVELVKLDQSNEEELKLFVQDCNNKNIKFKVILDDGSHLMRDQQISFFYLFDLLEDGGIFIMEDIHSSQDYPGYDVLEDFSNTTRNIFLKMKDNSENFRSIYINDLNKCDEISQQILKIDNYFQNVDSQFSIIYKKH